MYKSLKYYTRTGINRLLKITGFELVRKESKVPFEDYLDFKNTIREAYNFGMKVGDYIENKSKVPGSSQKTIDKMRRLGVFSGPVETVCEIGPGSGRYLEKTIAACNPYYYEIYETASEWATWLMKEYNVHPLTCDGMTLKDTASKSIDLVQAHKLFSGLPFFTTCSYFNEMARVIRKKGKIVFDIFTEDCMDDTTLKKWFNAKVEEWNWTPCIMPKNYVIRFFQERDVNFVGSFYVPLFPGKTECLVFQK